MLKICRRRTIWQKLKSSLCVNLILFVSRIHDEESLSRSFGFVHEIQIMANGKMVHIVKKLGFKFGEFVRFVQLWNLYIGTYGTTFSF